MIPPARAHRGPSLKLLPALACAALLLPSTARADADKAESFRQLAFGVKMAQNGSWNEAAFRFGKAVTADPGNAFARNDLGVALESVGQFDKALAAYEKALEIESGNLKIRENRDRLKAYLAGRTAPRTGAPEPASPAADPNSAPAPGGGGNR